MVTVYSLGDILTLKKRHPCGGLEWIVDRLGADIGITCQSCGRRILVPRSELDKRAKLHQKKTDS